MGTNYIAPIWRMPENTNKDKLSNYSLYFDGSSHEINCGTGDDVNITGPISISVWFNSDSVGNARGIVCKNNAHTSQNYAQYFFDLLSGDIRWRAGRSTVSYGINAGQWYHAVGVYDGSNTTLYIDGTQVATAAASATSYQSNQPMYIGRRLNQSYFLGEISQVCIFDYSLNQDQINYLYGLNNPMAISGAEPVAYYPLGDNSNPNTDPGYPNISVGADSVFDFDGAIGGALINVGNDSSLNITGSLSVSAWFKTLNNSDTIMIVTKDNGGASRAWQLYMHTTGAIRFGINGVTGIAVSSGVYDDGNWHHVLGVYEPSNYIKLYIDGLADGEDTTSVPASINSLPSQDVVIGGYDGYDAAGGRRWDGELSNIQIWDTDLQLSDAETLYNNGQPLTTGTQPQAANLQAWWKLNQTANWEADSVGNWQIPDAISAFPQSFNFIAANSDYIDAGNLDELKNITELSVSLWFNYDSILTSADGLVARDASTRVDGNWYVALDSNNSIRFLLKTANGQDALNSSTISADRWYHTLCVWTGDVMKIYLNGDLDNSITLSNATGTLGSASDIVAIGRRFASSGFLNGKASNVALWSSDQSSQVSNIYNNGTPATSYTNTPQYWYKLDNTAVWNPAPANYWTFPNAGIQVDSGTFNFSN